MYEIVKDVEFPGFDNSCPTPQEIYSVIINSGLFDLSDPNYIRGKKTAINHIEYHKLDIFFTEELLVSFISDCLLLGKLT